MAACKCQLLLLTLGVLLGATTFVAGHELRGGFRQCSSKSYPVTIKNVNIDPEPVVSGEPVTFTVPAHSNDELEGGTVLVTVSLYGFKVHSERDDLCGKTSCPIKGDFTLENSQELPSFTPPGHYKLKFQIYSKDHEELGCASVEFNIVWRSPALAGQVLTI